MRLKYELMLMRHIFLRIITLNNVGGYHFRFPEQTKTNKKEAGNETQVECASEPLQGNHL